MLRKGKIENPGFDKLRAIAKAMGFSPELWFEEAGEIGHAARIEQPPKKRNIAGRLNHLFEVIRNERTGEPYANAAQDIARDLADIAGRLASLKGEASAWLGDPNHDTIKLRLEAAHSAVEAAAVEARRRVRLNEGQ